MRSSATGTTDAINVLVPKEKTAPAKPHEFITCVHRRQSRIARRQHQLARTTTHSFEVINGERAICEVDRRELRVVCAEAAVSGDVYQLRAVHLLPDDVSRRIGAGEYGG